MPNNVNNKGVPVNTDTPLILLLFILSVLYSAEILVLFCGLKRIIIESILSVSVLCVVLLELLTKDIIPWAKFEEHLTFAYASVLKHYYVDR